MAHQKEFTPTDRIILEKLYDEMHFETIYGDYETRRLLAQFVMKQLSRVLKPELENDDAD